MSLLKSVLLLAAIGFLFVEAGDVKARIRVGGLLVLNREVAGNMKPGQRNSKLELNYISKRKVPNGPDPIHNRGAGKSHRPPGHA